MMSHIMLKLLNMELTKLLYVTVAGSKKLLSFISVFVT